MNRIKLWTCSALGVIALILLGLVLSGFFPSTQPTTTPIVLTIGTADSGGTMYPVGTAIASGLSQDNPLLKINLTASSGSTSNVIGLMNGQIDLGLVSGDIALCAYSGLDVFSDAPATQLRAIAAVYSSMSNWMVAADSGLEYVHQLKGYTIALGPEDSTTELSARIALEVLGIDETNSTLDELVEGTELRGVALHVVGDERFHLVHQVFEVA